MAVPEVDQEILITQPPLVYDKEELINETIDFISGFEGFSSCSYSDAGGYSIGYGTYSYKGECISEPEARRRVYSSVVALDRRINKRYKQKFTKNEKIAMISFAYNTPKTMPILNNKNCVQGFSNRNILLLDKCFRKYSWLRGLEIRRNAELELFKK